jgi:hypothetical protein
VRADPDFAAYVVARRPWVVRAYVLLGVPTAEAEALASDAFADVLPGWGALRRAGDRDVEVARVVLDRWARAGVGAPRSVSVPTPRLLTSELEERLALLTRLGDGLADLQETSRVAVVLHHVLGLDVADTAAALGETPPAVEYRLHDAARTLDLGPLDTVCHDAAAAIEVAPPDLAEISARSHSDARRRWLVGGALVVALVLVATGVAALVRPEPEPHLTPLTVTKEDTTVGVAWWPGSSRTTTATSWCGRPPSDEWSAPCRGPPTPGWWAGTGSVSTSPGRGRTGCSRRPVGTSRSRCCRCRWHLSPDPSSTWPPMCSCGPRGAT